jgi:alkylation response protein AidB-like acyl-CoA dehydrogenase
MNFDFNDEQIMMRDTVHKFFKKEFPPEVIRKLDEQEEYPDQLFKKMAKAGWTGLPFPEKYGGSGGSILDISALMEAIAYNWITASVIYSRTVIFGGLSMLLFGNEKQKETFIPRIINGDIAFSLGLTEADAGSDALNQKTNAIEVEDGYLLNGSKMWCSGANVADYILCVAITDKNTEKRHGLSVFLVDPASEGVTVQKIKTLGFKSTASCAVFFDNVRVPKENLLGKINEGWPLVKKILQYARACLSPQLVGCSQRIIDETVKYANERVQFGRPIGSFQAIQHKLADIQCQVDAARLLAYRVSYLASENRKSGKESSMAKLYASETWAKAADVGMQVFGGYGYSMEFDIQRYFRDSRLTLVGEGSSEIQRNIIAKYMGLPD